MATPTTIRSQKYRTGLREAGYRPVQIWVQDTRRPEFAAECRRQSQSLRERPQETEDNAWSAAAAESIEGWK